MLAISWRQSYFVSNDSIVNTVREFFRKVMATKAGIDPGMISSDVQQLHHALS
jgi:hypothetical protein